MQKKAEEGAPVAVLGRRVTPHTFRHGFARHLLEAGVNIPTVQELMGHEDEKMTEIYTHVAGNMNG